jgi:F-type H+-transporting ATPase subunit b
MMNEGGGRISRLKILGGVAAGLLLSCGSAFGAGVVVIPDASVFIQIVNFLFLIWALNVILYRPIRKILIQRKEKIEGLQQAVDNGLADAKDTEKAYAEGIKDARVAGLKEKESLAAEAAAEEKKVIDEINQKAQADLNEVRQKLADDMEQVRQKLMEDVDGYAKAIGEKILGRAV